MAIFDQQEASRVTDQWVQVYGEARGQVRGETIGQARAVLRVLATRGFHVPEPLRVRVLACMDLATLDRWLDAAISAPSMEAFGCALD
ncbi:MAG: hypothetical protein WCI05_07995 [Myxococcales bacterium]